MLSRLALRNAQVLPVLANKIQAASTSSFPPLKRPEFPSPVRHGFIPEEWFTFFYQKTGASGPYMFIASVTTFLVSKEYYVLEHEYYNGLSMLMIWIFAVKKYGPSLAKYLDKEIDNYEELWNSGRRNEQEMYENGIEMEKKEQWRAEAQQMIMDVKKENIKMQLEASYRERLARVYNEVKQRLDYQVHLNNIERRIAQKHMAQWIIDNVLKAITPEQEKAALNQCIVDLQSLSQQA